MIDPARVLQPLDEVEGAIRILRDYETPDQLADAVRMVEGAVERALRLLLRSDSGAPDALRLAALSPADLPFEELVQALRQRSLISLELGGLAHELRQAAGRAAAHQPRAADADVAQRVASRLRAEVHALGEQPMRSAAHHAVEERAVGEEPSPVPPPARRTRGLLVGIAVAVAALVLVFLIVGRLADGTAEAMDRAIADFRAGRLDSAEVGFRTVVERDPENVSALLYLGRIYRRQGRLQPAADRLREAVRIAPEDADVRRELGHLFADLRRPEQAIEQYRRAVELEPEASANWLALIHALRAAGSPEADDWLRRAPPEVQAALGGPS
ncbi:MAG TPA: tetratricopeptide repeat protein [Longimicrobiales bacterium]